MSHGLDETRRLRRLRAGERDAIIDSVKASYIASEVRGFVSGTTNRTGEFEYEESSRNFLPLNEIGPIIDTRVNETPSTWALTPAEDGEAAQKFCDDFNGWAAQPSECYPDLFSATPEIIDDQEGDGTAAIVMGRTDGRIWFEIRDSAGISVERDPGNPYRPLSVTFRWYVEDDGEDGKKSRTLHEETITATGRVMREDGQETPDGVTDFPQDIGMVPVVLIPRRFRKGSLLGDSGVAELEQAQNAYLMALHLLFTNNKYAASPVLCPDPATDQGEFAGDTDQAALSSLTVFPGALIPVPVKQVGGNANSPDMREMISMALRSLRRQGKVREEGDGTADARSGKAMLVGSEAMRAYVARKVVLLKLGLRCVATLWGILSGRLKPGQVAPGVPEFASSQDDDAQEITKRAEFWLKVLDSGYCDEQQFYTQLQRLQLIDEDADPAMIAEQVAQIRQAKEAEQMDAMAERLNSMKSGEDQPPQDDSGEGVSDGAPA